MKKDWMIYGANGYTGQLISREAVKRDLRPVIAGRSSSAIPNLASELGLDYRVFPLSDLETVVQNLANIELVLNCAGPFAQTSQLMSEACLSTKCHYLDITGELTVFEQCFQSHSKALQSGCVICPGVAFEVVPTEAVAAKLKTLLPDADSLKLGFDGPIALSRGTSLTILDGIGNVNYDTYLVRENAKLKALKKPRIENHSFSAGEIKRKAMTINWADLNAAYFSTNIPNIAVFIPASVLNRITFAYLVGIRPLMSFSIMRSLFEKMIKWLVKSPSTKKLESGSMTIFGEASNSKGDQRRVYIKVAPIYKFSYLAAVSIIEFCLTHDLKGGYYTPSMLVGPDFIETLEGSSKFILES